MVVSYCVYLRDTNNIIEHLNLAIEESYQAVMDLIESTIDNDM
jgi:hypothetical protein